MTNIRYILSKGYAALQGNKACKRAVVWLWILGIGYYIVGMLMPLAQSALLDGAAEILIVDNVLPWQLVIGVLGMVLFTLYKTNYFAMTKCQREIATQTIQTHIQGEIFSKMCKISYSHFNTPKIYDEIQTLSGRFASYCSNFLAGPILSGLAGTILSFVFTTIILFSISPVVAILMVCGNLFGIFKTYLEAKLNYYNVVQNMRERRFADAYINPMFDRAFVKEVRLYGLQDYLTDKWLRFISKVNTRTLKYNFLFSVMDFFMYGISYAFLISSLIVTAVMILNGTCSIGTFLLVYSSSGALVDTSGNLFHTFKELKLSSYYVALHKSFEELLDVEPESLEESVKLDTDMDIELRNVSFTYEGATKSALSAIDLVIKQGEKVAIVGENGCGKTTLVSLLNRLYLPCEGQILISGHPCENVVGDLRAKCSTLFQDFGTYETTIRENITMGSIHHELSDNELKEICDKAGLSEWIATLPEGLDTPIGRFQEDGVDLSGGQWQKIAIARSMARKGRRIVIMDEPNAALDPIAEATLYKQVLANMAETETLILISHRLGAVKYADRILVMANGEIVEEGTHDELMGREGIYCRMYTEQVKWYM